MKRQPNSRTNLDKAIQRFAGEIRRANELRALMANAIVAQMIGDGVVKRMDGTAFPASCTFFGRPAPEGFHSST